MARGFSSWVPGHAVVTQDMGAPQLDWGGQWFTDVNGYREGFGVHFRLNANQSTWFHAAIPTAVIIDGARTTLGRVMLLYEVPEGGMIDQMQVWDGPNLLLWPKGLTLAGTHHHGLDGDNTWTVNHNGIQWGVGISVHVTTVSPCQVFFGSAGADFTYAS